MLKFPHVSFLYNPELVDIYNEKLREFNKNHTSEEINIFGQFNGIGFMSKSKSTRVARGLSETFAELTMLPNTNSKNWTSSRSYYLQRCFPKTMVKVQELLDLRLSEYRRSNV